MNVPEWRTVEKAIPSDWQDNGRSAPFKKLWYLFLTQRAIVNSARMARIHDFLFGPGRLLGSPIPPYDLAEANECYRVGLRDMRHPIMARIDRRGLAIGSKRAWDRSASQMVKWEWRTYDDFMRDVDKSFRSKGGGEVG